MLNLDEDVQLTGRRPVWSGERQPTGNIEANRCTIDLGGLNRQAK